MNTLVTYSILTKTEFSVSFQGLASPVGVIKKIYSINA
jgi:hypothetical protein